MVVKRFAATTSIEKHREQGAVTYMNEIILIDEMSVNIDARHVVYKHGTSQAGLIPQYMLQEGRLSRAQKATQQSHRQF